EMRMLRQSLGATHLETNSILECQRGLLKSGQHGLAGWRLETRTHNIQKADTASLLFVNEYEYACPPDAAVMVISRLMQAPPSPVPSYAPNVVQQSWWHISAGGNNLAQGHLHAAMVYQDGRALTIKQQNTFAASPPPMQAEIELDIVIGPSAS